MAIAKFKCARCGVPCISWLDGWKHAGGQHTPQSCGQPPQPVRADTTPLRERICTPVSVSEAAALLTGAQAKAKADARQPRPAKRAA